MDVYGRVARLLLDLAVEENGRWVITEKLTQQDIADRVANRIQLTSDGFRVYLKAVEKVFGEDSDAPFRALKEINVEIEAGRWRFNRSFALGRVLVEIHGGAGRMDDEDSAGPSRFDHIIHSPRHFRDPFSGPFAPMLVPHVADHERGRLRVREVADRRASRLGDALGNTISARIGTLSSAKLNLTQVSDSISERTFFAALDSATRDVVGLNAISVVGQDGQLKLGRGAVIGTEGLVIR